MNKKVKEIVLAGLIAAVYVVLCYAQDFILPGSGTWAVQYRISEALCVLALFTPAAIPGLTVGCFLFNLSAVGALPLDIVIGSGATLLATVVMYLTRNWKVKSFPVFALLMPALFNGLMVGWELSFYIGGAFWFNAGCVALGEIAVLFTLGIALYFGLKARNLDARLFS